MAFKVFVGWDPREDTAYLVAKRSIERRSKKVRSIPIELGNPEVQAVLTRPIDRSDPLQMFDPVSKAPQSSEFAISRFCVPFLCDKGWALFVDCDVLCLADVSELAKLADPKYAVMVVKRKDLPAVAGPETKMDNQIQTAYPRKYWSSVVLWNCEHEAHKKLTPELLNTATGKDLHAFCWLKDEEIGALPPAWNYLVGVDPAAGDDLSKIEVGDPSLPIKLAHFTLGGPWLKDWKGGPFDAAWLAEAAVCKVTKGIGLKGPEAPAPADVPEKAAEA